MEESLGIRRWKVNLSDWMSEVQQISEVEGFTTIAAPESPEPELSKEHSHSADEVRLILSGSAYFIVRIGESEEFITVNHGEGELLSMPAGIWHKLGPGEGSYTSVRFFHDKSTWSKTMRE